jgi:hypothetical protein
MSIDIGIPILRHTDDVEPWKCLARHPTRSITISFELSLSTTSLIEKSLARCPHKVILKLMSQLKKEAQTLEAS